MSLYPKDKNPVFQPGGYGQRYDGQAEAIARAGEPPINYAPGQELSRAAPALPEHPTYGAARAFRDHLTGEYVVAARLRRGQFGDRKFLYVKRII
ncbi:TPA: hypothetical protein ACSXS5_004379 [Escherichia coli]